MRRAYHILSAVLLIAVGVAAGPVLADDLSLYEGSVPVNSQSPAERAKALPGALAQVIAKVSGQRYAVSSPAVRAVLGQATQIVTDTRYSTDSETVGGAPVYRQKMIARFDRTAVDALVIGAGLPVWPSPRPVPVLWLVIDDGHGARMVTSAHTNVVRSLTDRGNDRGLAFQLPTGTTAESLAGLRAVALGQAQAVVAPSAAYGSTVQLVGKLVRTPSGWNANWVLLDDGVELSSWSEVNPDARAALANGAEASADALAKHYARAVVGGPAGVFTVEIDGLRSGDDYVRMMGYLQSMGVVRHIVLLDAIGDHLRMQLDLANGIDGFRSLVAAGRVLQADGDGSAPVFRLK
jgi:hypothetical protein